MPVHKCPNGKYRIGSGPCNFTSKEKAERAYAAYRAQKHDSYKRGKYSNCIKGLLYQGFSEKEAELACSKFLVDETEDDIWDINTDFVDSETVEDRLTRYHDEHPEWSYDEKVGMAQAIMFEDIGDITLSNIIKRSRSLSMVKFSTLIKRIRVKTGLKVPHMGLLPQKTYLPMKNMNRLQTKLEKLFTAEQKWLTAEQQEQRSNYARFMRKGDTEDESKAFGWYGGHPKLIIDKPEMTDEEYTDTMNDLAMSMLDYFPTMTIDDAIEAAFMPPQGDKAWIMSNEAQIISMNDGLNNVIKAPIILAREMIQEYKNEKGETEYHFKSYEELELAAERFGADDSLDMIIEHQDWYDKNRIIGKVKSIRGDPESRTLRGMGYFYVSKLPQGLKDSIAAGEIVAVSIGFLAQLGDAGEWNGQKYNYKQINIHLRHLAICLDSVPRCPVGMCGINLEDAENNDISKIYVIIKKPNYYLNICNKYNDSKTETNTESSIIENEENEIMHEDSEGKIKSEEPSDLEAILQRLRSLMNNDNWETELKHNAIARILSALGIKGKSDNNMDEKEFSDAIAKKEKEIESLKIELSDAKDLISKFEAEKRVDLIKKIKKFGNKYSDEELEAKDLDTLKIIADAFSKFTPSEEEPDVVPIKAADDKEELEKELGKDVERIDFSKTFEDVNKEFGL